MKTLVPVSILGLAMAMAAQTAPDSASVTSVGPGFPPPPPGGMISMQVDNMDAAPVKGAPFCANVITEHTQQFADGNRIHTTDNSRLCRDSEGRTRREASLNLLGASTQRPATKLITITDPVAGVRYLLDPENKIARKVPMPFAVAGAMAGGAPLPGIPSLPDKGEHVMVYQGPGGPGPDVFYHRVLTRKPGEDAAEAPATENLGDQMIDGIHATGTRMVTTIPAGKMGNEQPMQVTSERWYSPELKASVMTRHSDPWAGELKTEFTGVSTAEPDPSMFSVPSDYKVVDEKAGPLMIQLPAPR